MAKVGFFGSIGRLWANIFDYKGKASKREYWFPVLFSAILGSVAFLMFYLSDVLFTWDSLCWYTGMILTAYLCLSVVPFIALTVRRLHDTGRKGWWTFLLLVIGIGTLCIMMMCAGNSGSSVGIIFNPLNNVQEDVYGPPEWFDSDYDPEEATPVPVYGPPEWFQDTNTQNDNNLNTESSQNDDTNIDEKENRYEAILNSNEDVYGPPEWFDEYDYPEDDELAEKTEDNLSED